jgi:hypothetical protein
MMDDSFLLLESIPVISLTLPNLEYLYCGVKNLDICNALENLGKNSGVFMNLKVVMISFYGYGGKISFISEKGLLMIRDIFKNCWSVDVLFEGDPKGLELREIMKKIIGNSYTFRITTWGF